MFINVQPYFNDYLPKISKECDIQIKYVSVVVCIILYIEKMFALLYLFSCFLISFFCGGGGGLDTLPITSNDIPNGDMSGFIFSTDKSTKSLLNLEVSKYSTQQ